MNDFTKDELLKIHEACIFWFDNGYQGTLDEAKELNIKIKFLIDNYCKPQCPSAHEFYEKLVCGNCGQIEDI